MTTGRDKAVSATTGRDRGKVVSATRDRDKDKAVSVTRDPISAMGPVATGGLAKVKPTWEIRDPISETSPATAVVVVSDREATLSTRAMAPRHATFPSGDKPVSVTAAPAKLRARPEAAEVEIKWVAAAVAVLTLAAADAAVVEADAAAAAVAGEVVVVAIGVRPGEQTNSRTTAMIETVSLVRRSGGLILVATILGWCTSACAQEQFKSPEEAVDALVSAAKSEDKSAVLAVLGPDGRDIVTSGDDVADRTTRENFVTAYTEKHTVSPDGDAKSILVIGNNDWPFPIPIVNKDGTWRFDTKSGLDEILRRRIGRDELAAIQVSLAYVQAQNEYASLDPAGLGPHAYAQRIVSSPGKKDGLYWPTAGGEEPSPFGDLAAKASAEGYKVGQKPIPYHGYFYRILKRQGGDAPGGAFDYVVKGKMIGGFALVAYPAEYGNSGIMTFIVNHDGVVFQKDLGPDTGKIARKIESFAPDQSWTKVDNSG